MSVSEACGWWRDLVGHLPRGWDMDIFASVVRRYSADKVKQAIGVVGQAQLPRSKRIALLCAYFGESP